MYDLRCETKDVADTGLQRQAEHEKQTTGIEQCGENVSNDYGKRFKEQYNGITERPGDIDRCDAGRKAEHSGWSVEPAICRMADGLSDELYGYQGRLAIKPYQRVDRLKGLGNSIVPQIAELLFNQIKPLL